jgi:hypothetical protein
VQRVFHAALGHEPADRARFLDQACADDEELRKEVNSRAEWMIYVSIDPRFDILRDDPRFMEIVRRTGPEKLTKDKVHRQFEFLTLLKHYGGTNVTWKS